MCVGGGGVVYLVIVLWCSSNVISSFAIIMLRMRKLDALIYNAWWLVTVIDLCVFLTVLWLSLWYMVVALPGHHNLSFDICAATCDFQQYGILKCVDSYESV